MKLLSPSKKAVVDPVCGMKVDPCKTNLNFAYDDKQFYFCAEGCRQEFKKNPVKYKNTTSAKKKGMWGRYLDRLNKSTDGKAMKCH